MTMIMVNAHERGLMSAQVLHESEVRGQQAQCIEHYQGVMGEIVRDLRKVTVKQRRRRTGQSIQG